MEKNYSPDFEQDLYESWMTKKYFKANANKNKKPFTIIMPPPNVTSKLHMGHAFQQTIQDIIIRRKRMQGYEALWLPGTDHAAIATETMIVKKLAKDGLTKEGLGRAKFMEYVNDWYSEYKGAITNQFKRMGFSCDWERLAFTMDDQNSRAVRYVFVEWYKKGLIYKGKRIVNWCPKCKSTISDAEVEFKERADSLWYVSYPIENTQDSVIIATTRPETIPGDTAIAVNPKDKRYKKFIGKNAILPLNGKKIPIIADDYVEINFGTGALKITPAHDPNDYEVGQRHNLESVSIMDEGGILNENAGKYKGLTREQAREAIVADLKAIGNLVKIEDYTHNVTHCERCKTAIEPLISSQWFVKMKELAAPAIKVVETGEVKFSEDQYKKSYLHWMKNLNDWCISRQVWNGHRIPIFICADCGELIVEHTDPSSCPKCKSKNFLQEQDTLDTWFSSALWPLSTLGFPDKNPDLDYFYPTNVLVTAREIIYLWVARMIFCGLDFKKQIPFKDVVINGIVNDAQGRKMSKTLGNGTDPIDVINKYGVDTLRFSLFNGVFIGSDSRFSEKRVEVNNNFINKIWNASRYVLMQLEGKTVKDIKDVKLNLADKWILTELNALIKQVNKNFDSYDIGLAAGRLYDFFWGTFCDWYIELSKCDILSGNDEASVATLKYVLTALLKMLHPFIPFITEKIYLELPNPDAESIVISAWVKEGKSYTAEHKQMTEIMSVIKSIRECRAENKIADNKRIDAKLFPLNDVKFSDAVVAYIKKLTLINDLQITKEESSEGMKLIFNNCKINLLLSKEDAAAQKAKLADDLKHTLSEIERCERMLSNAGFVAKAPESLINAEKEKLAKFKELKESLEKELKK